VNKLGYYRGPRIHVMEKRIQCAHSKLKKIYLTDGTVEDEQALKKLATLYTSKHLIRDHFLSCLEETTDRRLSVKIIITELSDGTVAKSFRKILSHTTEARKQKYGMFHTAVSIGPLYLEWVNNGLVIPRICRSRRALIAADLDEMILLSSNNNAMDRIAEVISRWNGHYQYNQRSSNCQHFVDDLLNTIRGTDTPYINSEDPLSQFLTSMRNNGSSDLQFTMSPRLQLLSKSTSPIIKFKTHNELDLFLNKVTMDLEGSNYLRNDEYGKLELRLLKSFDRAFWLKRDDSKHSCPFGNPYLCGGSFA
jgi:hypothetical protein